MRPQPRIRRPPGRKRLSDERSPLTPQGAAEAKPKADTLSSSYSAGTAVQLRANGDKAMRSNADPDQHAPSLALGSTQARQTKTTAYGNATTVRLRGETEPHFDGGTSRIVDRRVRRATGCENCDDDSCLRVTGTLVLTYRVTTTVTLPSVNDFPDLSDCQKRRVQDAIDNVLAPHEQDHVRAFETYNGTTRHPFDIKVCNAEEASAALQQIHDSDAETRQNNAQALSDALDPFHFDVDLDCEDEK